MATLIVASLLMPSGATIAQDCTIAAYLDPAGTQSIGTFLPTPEDPLISIYIVMFVENSANAVAYKANFEFYNQSWFLQARWQGSSGQGLFIDEDPTWAGTNVALGECVLGFGGAPVLVEEYLFAVVGDELSEASVTLSANTNQHPASPVYVTCNSTKQSCEVGPRLLIVNPIPTRSASFGKIKSLYN